MSPTTKHISLRKAVQQACKSPWLDIMQAYPGERDSCENCCIVQLKYKATQLVEGSTNRSPDNARAHGVRPVLI